MASGFRVMVEGLRIMGWSRIEEVEQLTEYVAILQHRCKIHKKFSWRWILSATAHENAGLAPTTAHCSLPTI